MAFFFRYTLIILAAIALLTAVQIPSFLHQYTVRLQAHWFEVTNNIAPWQKIADDNFSGSLRRLINKHQSSNDDVFKAEAGAIKQLLDREAKFKRELKAMQGSLLAQLWHVAVYADSQLQKETYDNYTYTVVLNRDTVLFSLGFMLTVVLLIEVLGVLIQWPFRATSTERIYGKRRKEPVLKQAEPKVSV